MGGLRLRWRRVLACDRSDFRIPRPIQVWLLELFFVMPLTVFIGKVIDIHPGAGPVHAPKTSPLSTRGLATALAAVGFSAVGCGGSPAPPASSITSTSTAAAQPGHSSTAAPPYVDYTGLLIQASDINAPEAYTGTSTIANPNHRVGATTTFSNADHTHVIYDTLEVLADPAGATAALDRRKGGLDGFVHGVPEPIAVGSGGTLVPGPSPDGAKSVSVLLFTEGRVFVQMEFDGPQRASAPKEFVADVGRKQDAAIKQGLPG